MFVFAIALSRTSFRAQQQKSIRWNADSSQFCGSRTGRAGRLQKIFCNLGRSPSAYFSGGGLAVSRPNAVGDSTHFVAMPFTPNANAQVQQVGTAV